MSGLTVNLEELELRTVPSPNPVSGMTASPLQLEQAMERALDPMKCRFIPRNRITQLDLISTGGYGEVWRAELKDPLSESTPPQLVAIKKLFPAGARTERIGWGVTFARELRVWGIVEHENVLPLIGFFLDPEAAEAIFISPYQRHGSLLTYLRDAKPDRLKRLQLAENTAKGLEYLHTMKPVPICHGDIKPANVVVNDHEEAMLCDLGLARIMEDHPSGLTLPGFHEARTVRYMSPELFIIPGARRNLESDVWAWAALLHQVLTNVVPFSNLMEPQALLALSLYTQPASSEVLRGLRSSRLEDLLIRCWDKDPCMRPNMLECRRIVATEKSEAVHTPNHSTKVPAKTTPLVSADHGWLAGMSQTEVPGIGAVGRKLAEALDQWQDMLIERSRIALVERLDRSGFGDVWIANLEDPDVPPRKVAVNRLVPRGERPERLHAVVGFVRELGVWAVAKHPNILPLVGFYLDPRDASEALFISQFQPNGNIEMYLQTANPNPAKRLELAIDTAEGLAYLHNFRPAPICHGNIKPANILINSEPRAMLCDFGLSAAMVDLPIGPTTSGFANAKTTRYQSFELFNAEGARRNLKTDVWAWAALLLQILTDRRPYHHFTEIQVYTELHRMKPPAHVEELQISARMKRLLTRCWDEIPGARPDMDQCADDVKLERRGLTLAVEIVAPAAVPEGVPGAAPKRGCRGVCIIQ